MIKKFNKPERPLDRLKKSKTKKREAQLKIYARIATLCLKCNAPEELNINGLCSECEQGKRYGSKK